jgi:hypothetical protein
MLFKKTWCTQEVGSKYGQFPFYGKKGKKEKKGNRVLKFL